MLRQFRGWQLPLEKLLEIDLNILTDSIFDTRDRAILLPWSSGSLRYLIICESLIITQRRNAF